MRRIIDPASQSTLMFAFSHGTSSPEVLEGLENPESRFLAARDGGADCIFIAPGLIHSLAPLIRESRDLGIVAKITSTASRGGERHQERLIALGRALRRARRRRRRRDDPVRARERARRDLADGADRRSLRPARDALHRRGRVPQRLLRLRRRLRDRMGPALPEAERPPLRRARRRHRQEQLARLGRGVRRDRRVRLGPGRRRRRLARRRPRPAAEGRRGARGAGAVGCSVGRNIFQHDEPAAMVAAISAVVRGNSSPEEALAANFKEKVGA